MNELQLHHRFLLRAMSPRADFLATLLAVRRIVRRPRVVAGLGAASAVPLTNEDVGAFCALLQREEEEEEDTLVSFDPLFE